MPPPRASPALILVARNLARQQNWGCAKLWRFFDAYAFYNNIAKVYDLLAEHSERAMHEVGRVK
jgi:hypothetical protein